MVRKNNITLKLFHTFYDPSCIELAAGEFSELAEIALAKHGKYTEVLIANNEEKNISLEFANYALFLTIQLK